MPKKAISQISLVDINAAEFSLEPVKKLPILTTKAERYGDILNLDGHLVDTIESRGDYNNKYDRKAEQFQVDAKRRYVTADRHFYSETGGNMKIHSGRRTVRHQAELFIKHKWHGQGNPASWPGCSLHNWGLAADMIRTDEKNVIAAMKKGGWAQTVADEGWHFECTSASGYGQAQKKIAAFRVKDKGLAYKWSEQVAYFYIKTKDYNVRAPAFNARLEKHRQSAQALKIDIDRFNADVSKLKSRMSTYNSEVRRYNRELQRARNLVDEINSMPSGPARNQKIREFRQLEAWLNGEESRLTAEGNSIDRENNRLSRASSALNNRIAAFKSEDAWISKEHNELTKKASEIEQHANRASSLLTQIEKAVPR